MLAYSDQVSTWKWKFCELCRNLLSHYKAENMETSTQWHYSVSWFQSAFNESV